MQLSASSMRSGVRAAGVSRRSAVRVQANARVDRSSKNDIIVSPSILSADFSKLGEQVGGQRARGGAVSGALTGVTGGPHPGLIIAGGGAGFWGLPGHPG